MTRFRGDDDPFAVHEHWDEQDGFEREEFSIALSEFGTASLELPAAAVALLSIDPA